MIGLFALGFAMGLFAAAMPGPINVEVVRRALSRGPRLGFAFGLGAVTADVIYVTAASFGAVALISALSDTGRGVLWLIGSGVLTLIGIKALRAKPAATPGFNDNSGVMEAAVPAYNPSLPRAYIIGLVLTLTSPGTLFYWLFASVGAAKIAHEELQNPPYILVAGVAAACTLWVLIACLVAGHFHRKIQPRAYLLIDRAAGLTLIAFAAYSFLKGMRLLPYF